jgi:hypothetical protein
VAEGETRPAGETVPGAAPRPPRRHRHRIRNRHPREGAPGGGDAQAAPDAAGGEAQARAPGAPGGERQAPRGGRPPWRRPRTGERPQGPGAGAPGERFARGPRGPGAQRGPRVDRPEGGGAEARGDRPDRGRSGERGPRGDRPRGDHPRGERPRFGKKGFGRSGPERRPEPKLYSFESVVDRGFEDVADEANEGATKRVHWTIVKRTVADQRTAKPVSAKYVLSREGAESEFPSLALARQTVNKTIAHPEKLTKSKAEHAKERDSSKK